MTLIWNPRPSITLPSKSELYRTAGLLRFVGHTAGAYTIARALVFGEFRLLLAQTVVLTIAIAHEAIMVRAIRRALKHDKDVSAAAWMLNVFVESQLPTVALFLLLTSQWLTPSHRCWSLPPSWSTSCSLSSPRCGSARALQS